MIRVEIAEHVTESSGPYEAEEIAYTLRVCDGANRNILLSSTSQMYSNRGFVEKLALRLFGMPPGSPSGTENVELWFVAADGTDVKLAELR